MIYNFTVVNHLNEVLSVELADPYETGIIVESIEGLGPVQASVNTSELTGLDGALFISSKTESRNIVFNLSFDNTKYGDSVEKVRLRCNRIFTPKRPITMAFLTENRYVAIIGYVESNDENIFSDQAGTQISVICPDPFFYRIDTDNKQHFSFTNIQSLFHFPYFNASGTKHPISAYNSVGETSFRYDGEMDVGMTITITVFGSVSGIRLYKVDTNEALIIDTNKITSFTGTALGSGDVVVISTGSGNKKASLIRNGETINIINCITRTSNWILLSPGDNMFRYLCDSGSENIVVDISYDVLYIGI